jgi:hypothetical protein
MMTDLPELPDPGEVPVLDWISVDVIGVEETYQRPLDMNRVENIVRNFSWRSFGALVIVPQDDGSYHVTDGQHRLEAAKLHPKVTHIPAIIVKADDIREEAGIFVDINKNRKNVNALELFFAQLTAGDPEAETILEACQRAGVRVPKYASKGIRARDTIAISAIKDCISRRGQAATTRYLELLARAEFAPIRADHIKAVELLMNDAEFADHIAFEDLTATVRSDGVSSDVEAKRFSTTHCVPMWKGLANIWFQKTKKRKPQQVRVA